MYKKVNQKQQKYKLFQIIPGRFKEKICTQVEAQYINNKVKYEYKFEDFDEFFERTTIGVFEGVLIMSIKEYKELVLNKWKQENSNE